MKARISYPDHFHKSTMKSADEIKRTCRSFESHSNRDYIVKQNGNHIWLEVAEDQQQVWSPLLHLEVSDRSGQTVVKGQYVENPVLWVFLLVMRTVAFVSFVASVLFLYVKISASEPAGKELLFMFGAISLWFGLALLAQWNRRISYKQAARLHDLMENIVA
ncbi:hypothetical protein [Flavobacterium selenitireducens]|uniref:hypothetical protein n=1 Tax=Flavobacterium selenitireducens TaxID=2722704 RepID=UPI00168A9F35|nr:hypothetical protein [Flavobacterium selenitireducens]MBD3583356.1 hypothetical protein [Flavobacterium selenitireducens]